jgi:hypothetical protein
MGSQPTCNGFCFQQRQSLVIHHHQCIFCCRQQQPLAMFLNQLVSDSVADGQPRPPAMFLNQPARDSVPDSDNLSQYATISLHLLLPTATTSRDASQPTCIGFCFRRRQSLAIHPHQSAPSVADSNNLSRCFSTNLRRILLPTATTPRRDLSQCFSTHLH